MQRDGYQKSLWQDTAHSITQGTNDLPFDMLDVVVVGGGLTGLSTALALREAGLTCLVAEARNIGFGTTSGTSAHINTVLDLSYDRMIVKFGEEQAKLVAKGAQAAVDRIEQLSKLHAPNCNWMERDAYLFAKDEKQAEELERIVEGTKRVGLHADLVDHMPFPGPFMKAARFPGQAQFHPARYIHGLAAAFKAAGGVLMEECRVLEVEPKDEALEVVTERGTVRARHLVYATHIPPGVNILHFRNAPYRSYVLSARLRVEAELPAALVYDMEDPYHYYRTEDLDGDRVLIAGGCDHKTGHEVDTTKRFQELEAHVRGLFGVEAVTHQWSSQYFEPADGLPYIGKLPMADDRIFVATGFNGNGMTLGTLASIILADLIVAKSSPYEKVFDPARVSVVAGFANFVKEAVDVVGHLVAAPFPAKRMAELEELTNGEGRVVQYDGRSIAVHRDEDGQLHAVDPACSHIKCTVAWNGAERSWDCPCHGSRFSVDGSVLTAPSRKPLQRLDLLGDTEMVPDGQV
jgi:glycine/D-amino acid oxidase-like deaminating enzyme/nitrite reductase/ring-hydroxylating ferredoxin subunit